MKPFVNWEDTMRVTVQLIQSLREERDAMTEFGEEYARYAANTPGFIPRLGRKPRERKAD
jgi:protein-S-isoprenylcysteine O-methyltransferase Ste14